MTSRKVYPTYCPNCHKLMFIGKHQNHTLFAIDYEKSNWTQHKCTNDDSHIYQNELLIDFINDNNDEQPVPFEWLEVEKVYNRKYLRPGVVLSVESDSVQKQTLKVITTDNKLLTIKVVKSDIRIFPGHLIDLKTATRIGPNRFRLKEANLLDIPFDKLNSQENVTEFYKINISCEDQEKLELLVERVLQHLKQHQISIFGIIPLPIKIKNKINTFTRQLFILPAEELVKKIQLLHLPDIFTISLEQIKINPYKTTE